MLQQSLSTFRIQIERLVPQILTRFKSIDHSKVPVINEEDLDEQYVRGSGPGGQAVNKTANCVVLKHVPTGFLYLEFFCVIKLVKYETFLGIIIKCHESRSLSQNRKIARTILTTKLDNLINKDDSVENQIRKFEGKKIKEKNRRRNKLNELKLEWKQRENVD